MASPSPGNHIRIPLAVLAGLACAWLSLTTLLRPLDRVIYDQFNESSLLQVADDLVIVAIDERSLGALGRWPWRRENHVEVLRRLHRAGAAAIAVDVLFVEPERDYPAVDQLLAQTVQRAGNVVLPVFIGRIGAEGRLREMPPLPDLREAASGLGHVHIEVDGDGVARRVFLRLGVGEPEWPHFSIALMRTLGLPVGSLPGLSDPDVLAAPDARSIIASHENLIRFMGPPGTIPRVSYVDVMRGQVPDAALRDKVVFVGATAAGHVDNITTSLGQIPGVELNANLFHALRSGNLSQPLPATWAALIGLLITAPLLYGLTGLDSRRFLLAVLAGSLGLPMLAYLWFASTGVWLSPAPLVVTLLAAYPLWNWLRLDAAVRFIRRQLASLEARNAALSHHPGFSDVERAADLLLALDCVAGWQWQTSADTAAPAEHAADWAIDTAGASRYFQFAQELRRLRLQWSGDRPLQTAQLERVFPAAPVTAGAPRESDYFDVNLLQLDRAYREAEQIHALIRGTLQQMSAGVILADLSGDILLINAQACEQLQVAPGATDLVAAARLIELADEQDITRKLAALVLQRQNFRSEGHTPSGREILCQGGLIELAKPMLLLVLTDVSELKRNERRNREALNFLSHDLRAPLTSVLALIESARQEPAGERDDTLLNQIEQYVEKNLSYAENFIQLALIEQQRSPDLETCDARSLVDNAAAQLFHSARKRGVALELQYSEEDLWVECSRDLIERALINLVDNALKHSPDGATVTIAVEPTADSVVFRVSDRGPGMPAGMEQRLFASFQQGPGERRGVGLGLHFVSVVARNHGGAASVAPRPGGGSSFSLRIAQA